MAALQRSRERARAKAQLQSWHEYLESKDTSKERIVDILRQVAALTAAPVKQEEEEEDAAGSEVAVKSETFGDNEPIKHEEREEDEISDDSFSDLADPPVEKDLEQPGAFDLLRDRLSHWQAQTSGMRDTVPGPEVSYAAEPLPAHFNLEHFNNKDNFNQQQIEARLATHNVLGQLINPPVLPPPLQYPYRVEPFCTTTTRKRRFEEFVEAPPPAPLAQTPPRTPLPTPQPTDPQKIFQHHTILYDPDSGRQVKKPFVMEGVLSGNGRFVTVILRSGEHYRRVAVPLEDV